MNRILCLFLHEKHLLAATHEGENWQAALVSGERHWLPLNNEGSLRHAIDDLVARLGDHGMLEKYSLQIVADASSRSLLIGSQGLLAHGQFANWQASSWQVLDWQPLATRADWQGSGRPDHAWLQEHLLPILQTSLGWQKEALAEENEALRLRLESILQIDGELMIMRQEPDGLMYNENHKEKQMTTTNPILQILRHPKCPNTTLVKHLENTDEDIRAAIASNPALNEAQQNQLAEDKSVLVLLALLDNPRLSASNKARLDENLSVALEYGLSARQKDTPAKKAKLATKKTVAKKPAAKKVVAKKPVAKKPVAKKVVAKKPAAKKPAAKKVAAKKPAAKKLVDIAPLAPAPVHTAATWPFPTPGIGKN